MCGRIANGGLEADEWLIGLKHVGHPFDDEVLHELTADTAVEVDVDAGAGGIGPVPEAWSWAVGVPKPW